MTDQTQVNEGMEPVAPSEPAVDTGAATSTEPLTPAAAEPSSSYDFDRVLTDDEKVNLGDLFSQPKEPANGKEAPTGGAAQPAAQTAKVEEPVTPVKDTGFEQVQTAINLLAQNQQVLTQNQVKQNQSEQAPQAPLYDFKIPVETLGKVFSENVEERAQGLAQIMQGTAMAVHRNLTQVMNQYAQQEIPRVIQGHMEMQQAKQSIHNDFCGTYPELNRDEVKPLVLQVAQQVMQETGQTGWSNKLRDLTAQKVKAIITSIAGRQPQAAAPQGQAKPNFMSPNSGQYGAPSGYTQDELEIQELLAFSRSKGL